MVSKIPNEKQNKLNSEKVICDLIRFGLEKTPEKVESAALILSRLLKTSDFSFSQKIADIVADYSINGASMRGVGVALPPVDSETQLDIASLISSSATHYRSAPILEGPLQEKVENFLEERKKIDILLREGIRPTSSLLLIGQPGTGKTMLAHYLASALDKQLVILDLSTSISSLLGKTGHNIKRVLDYARNNSFVLLLDEFDAIAKKRDDVTDLGEIKRVVNVLLMELESWPISSLVIATSNHPELLDRAIWRRFDQVFELPLPGEKECSRILDQELKDFLERNSEFPGNLESFLNAIAQLLRGLSGADICKFSESIKKRVLIKREKPLMAFLAQLSLYNKDKKGRGEFCKLIKSIDPSITVRQLALFTGLSPAGVQHHLKKNDSR